MPIGAHGADAVDLRGQVKMLRHGLPPANIQFNAAWFANHHQDRDKLREIQASGGEIAFPHPWSTRVGQGSADTVYKKMVTAVESSLDELLRVVH